MTNMDLLPQENGLKPQEVGAVSAVAREQSEIQAAIISAKRFPRNETSATTKALKSFTRVTMAENAQYKFPRGGSTIVGPSVDCARELARCWGNIRYGIRLVSIDDEYIHIKGWAYDLESNNFTEHEDKFKKQVQRKIDGKATWINTTDERDLRELINRRGAIQVRNCILELLPPDLIEDVCKAANGTLAKKAAGELKTDKDQTLKRMAFGFDRLGVSVDMIERKLGHSLDLITETELTDLNLIYKSISDGNSKREEHFEFEESSTLNANLDAANEKLKSKMAAKHGGKSESGE